MSRIKCVVMGHPGVGKSSMVIAYTTNKFPTKNNVTCMDNYAVTIKVGGEPCILNLFDTAGQEDHDKLRTLIYPETNVFLICFSVASPTSFENVQYKTGLKNVFDEAILAALEPPEPRKKKQCVIH